MNQDELKQAVAKAAINYISPRLNSSSVIGVGTGSTANCFIDLLAPFATILTAPWPAPKPPPNA